MMSRHVIGKVAVTGLLAGAFFSAPLAADIPNHTEGRPHTYYFSMAGERQTFTEDGVTDVEVVVSNAHSEGRYSVIYSRWLPDFQVPAHYHKGHSETFYVLQGSVEWTVGGETRVLNAGDAVYIPPNTVHSVRVIGDEEMLSLFIYEPGGYEELSDYRMNYTEEELQDPEIRDRIRRRGDFHIHED